MVKQNKIFDCHAQTSVLLGLQQQRKKIKVLEETLLKLKLDIRFIETYKAKVTKSQRKQEKKEKSNEKRLSKK